MTAFEILGIAFITVTGVCVLLLFINNKQKEYSDMLEHELELMAHELSQCHFKLTVAIKKSRILAMKHDNDISRIIALKKCCILYDNEREEDNNEV